MVARRTVGAAPHHGRAAPGRPRGDRGGRVRHVRNDRAHRGRRRPARPGPDVRRPAGRRRQRRGAAGGQRPVGRARPVRGADRGAGPSRLVPADVRLGPAPRPAHTRGGRARADGPSGRHGLEPRAQVRLRRPCRGVGARGLRRLRLPARTAPLRTRPRHGGRSRRTGRGRGHGSARRVLGAPRDDGRLRGPDRHGGGGAGPLRGRARHHVRPQGGLRRPGSRCDRSVLQPSPPRRLVAPRRGVQHRRGVPGRRRPGPPARPGRRRGGPGPRFVCALPAPPRR